MEAACQVSLKPKSPCQGEGRSRRPSLWTKKCFNSQIHYLYQKQVTHLAVVVKNRLTWLTPQRAARSVNGNMDYNLRSISRWLNFDSSLYVQPPGLGLLNRHRPTCGDPSLPRGGFSAFFGRAARLQRICRAKARQISGGFHAPPGSAPNKTCGDPLITRFIWDDPNGPTPKQI